MLLSLLSSISRRLAASSSPVHEDAVLVERARDGDLDAFNILIDRYQQQVFRVCSRLLRDHHLAEDVTQETFIRAYDALDQYHGGSFRAWLLRIATNRSYDQLRRQQRRPGDSLEAEPVEQQPIWSTKYADEEPDHFAARQQLSAQLEELLDELSEDQRLTIVLYDIQGYSYDEIAEIGGVSLGTVKSRLNRARARLRGLLQTSETNRELFDIVSRQPDREDGN